MSSRVPACPPEEAPLGAGKQKYIQETWAPLPHSSRNIAEHNATICKSQPDVATSSQVPNCLFREKDVGVPGPRRPSGHQHRTRRTHRLAGRLAMYKPRFQYCFKHLRDQTPNHAVFLLFQLFRSKNVKFHAKDGSNQKRQKDESSSEAASEMHNPWLANHVYGLSGAQLQKSATGVTTASKKRKRSVTRTV